MDLPSANKTQQSQAMWTRDGMVDCYQLTLSPDSTQQVPVGRGLSRGEGVPSAAWRPDRPTLLHCTTHPTYPNLDPSAPPAQCCGCAWYTQPRGRHTGCFSSYQILIGANLQYCEKVSNHPSLLYILPGKWEICAKNFWKVQIYMDIYVYSLTQPEFS